MGGFGHPEVDICDTLNRHCWRFAGQENTIRIRIVGMVAMHADRPPARAVEVAVRNQPPGMKQKNHLTITSVGEENSKLMQFRISQKSSAWQILETRQNRLAGAVIEKPKSAHRGVVDGEIILRHAQT